MANDYAKCRLDMVYSENSNYGDPVWESDAWDPQEERPSEMRALKLTVDTSAVSLDMTDFASITGFAVKNLDDTNYITVTWTDVGTNTNSVRLLAGQQLFVPSVAPATNPTFTANTAACKALVAVFGSEA